MKKCGALALALVLAACGSAAPGPVADGADGDAAGAVAGDKVERIECAINGAQEFRRDCVVELTPDGNGQILVVRHPDGGFRRFSLKDGELAALDGSLPARPLASGTVLEVGVENDRYRFPSSPSAGEAP